MRFVVSGNTPLKDGGALLIEGTMAVNFTAFSDKEKTMTTTTNDPKKAYARLCRYWTPERVRALAEQNMRDRLARYPETALFKN